MLLITAAICVAVPHLSTPNAGETPSLRTTKLSLPASAISAAGFAPLGWRVERGIRGDLNKDGRSDLVAILKGVDPNCIVQPAPDEKAIDTNPRVVLIAFGAQAGFELRVANSVIIPRVDDPYMDDPLDLEALTIRDGVLRLGLSSWRSMGGWTSFSSIFSFRWDGKQFQLIGFDRETLQRNSGETRTLSVNFATKRARIVKGSIDDDVDDTTRWQHIPAQSRTTFETIGDGLAYEPKLGVRP
jgi:hypothetical protein